MAKKHKKKLQQKEQNYTVSEGNAFFYYCALIAFGVLLFYPPFFRGLFFKTEQQWTLIFAAVIFFVCCLWQVSKHDYSFLTGPQSYAVFGMLVVYIIAFFGAADTYLAVAEIIKMGIYFMVFWIAGRLVQEKGNEVIFIRILYFGGVCVALAWLKRIPCLGLVGVHGKLPTGSIRIIPTIPHRYIINSFRSGQRWGQLGLWFTWLYG